MSGLSGFPFARLLRSRGWFVAAILACAAPAVSGCGPSLSQIEQGKSIATSDAQIDDFLKAVIALREEVLRAEGDRKATQADLAKALGAPPDADAVGTLDVAAQKAKKLDGEGTSLHLEIAPDPKLCVLAAKRGKTSEDPEAIAKAVEPAVKAMLGRAKSMGEIDVRAKELSKKRAELATTPPGQKGDAARELEGATRVLESIRERAAMEGGLATSFVVGLSMALETGAADGALARFTGKTARPAGGGRPAGGSAPAQGAATPKPKPSDDFEP